MNFWQILGISPTDNKREIKRAYAQKLKQTDLEKNPKAYQQLREAFDRALIEADNPQGNQDTGVYIDFQTDYSSQQIPGQLIATELQTPDAAEHDNDDGWRVEPEIIPDVTIESQVDTVDKVLNDTLVSLHANGEKAAIDVLKSALVEPELQALDNRYRLEGGLILALVELCDSQPPMDLMIWSSEQFEWDYDNNPFKYDPQIRDAYSYLLHSLEREKNKRKLIEQFNKHWSTQYKIVYETLLGPYSEEKLRVIINRPDFHRAADQLIDNSRSFKGYTNPIENQSLIWWNNNKTTTAQTQQSAPNNRGSGSGWLVYLAIVFIILIPVRLINYSDYSNSNRYESIKQQLSKNPERNNFINQFLSGGPLTTEIENIKDDLVSHQLINKTEAGLWDKYIGYKKKNPYEKFTMPTLHVVKIDAIMSELIRERKKLKRLPDGKTKEDIKKLFLTKIKTVNYQLKQIQWKTMNGQTKARPKT